MAHIAYVDYLKNLYQSKGFPPYRWSVHDSSPWTVLEKPLEKSCIGLISAGGISMEGQEPFDGWAINDMSFRQIPVETPFEKMRLNHNYFDHRDAVKDFNCVFPVRRLRELVESGYIQSMTSHAITMGMGRLYKRTALQTETVPELVEVLREQRADAVMLVAG
jgi:D-proline reductase (dithiol) PrdB